MILSSFKENQEIIRIPPTFLPEKPTFEHYQLVLGEKNFGLFFWNSLWLTIVRTSIVLYSGAFFGYVFSALLIAVVIAISASFINTVAIDTENAIVRLLEYCLKMGVISSSVKMSDSVMQKAFNL